MITTKTEKQTLDFGKDLAKKLQGGDIVALYGELGAGKSVLTRGIAKGLGIRGPIQSPTFVLMKLYKVKKHPTIKQLCHVDAYRLDETSNLEDIGLQEYLGDAETVTVIEWAENVEGLLKAYDVLDVRIELDEKDLGRRRISIAGGMGYGV